MADDDRQNIFRDELTFEDLGLRNSVRRGLDKAGFKHPTDIQARLIPLILEGRDVLGQARTGTGKTAAFGLPLLHRVDPQKAVSALILVPTRELAMQVTKELEELAEFTPVKILAIYGGQKISTQAKRLKQGPSIIVGTPGRVMDMHGRGMLPYDRIEFAVLDEVDRMLDIGFRDDIRRILGGIKQRHQTIFVSATISGEIEALARTYMHEPEKVSTSAGSLTVEQVDQTHLPVERWDKRRLLMHLLKHEEPALTLVFCATKAEVDRVTKYLKDHGVEAHAIHGDMYQGKRNRVMEQFRGGELSVLVASDLAARGLDVDNVSHVVNYDIPNDPDIYVHRIGRTARIGRGGIAWTFVTPEEGELLTKVETLINREIPKKEYDDFEPSEMPESVRRQREEEQKRIERQREKHSRRFATTVPNDAAGDASKFPGGVVPKAPPRRRMHGRLRTRRR